MKKSFHIDGHESNPFLKLFFHICKKDGGLFKYEKPALCLSCMWLLFTRIPRHLRFMDIDWIFACRPKLGPWVFGE